jgi:tRNA A37 threonylcarbamoyltransferase TsaD
VRDGFGRRDLQQRLARGEGFTLRLADHAFCTDNAAMVGVLAERKLQRGGGSRDLDEEIQPGWTLG